MDYEKYLEKIKVLAKNSTSKQRVFFGLAMLLLIGVLIFLSNPSKRLLERRNSQRRSDVVNILNAVFQYRIDNKGELPSSISSTPTMICTTTGEACEKMVDFSEILQKEKKILSKIPKDPNEKNPNSSGYQIFLSASGRINVTAPLAENNAVISLSKEQ